MLVLEISTRRSAKRESICQFYMDPMDFHVFLFLTTLWHWYVGGTWSALKVFRTDWNTFEAKYHESQLHELYAAVFQGTISHSCKNSRYLAMSWQKECVLFLGRKNSWCSAIRLRPVGEPSYQARLSYWTTSTTAWYGCQGKCRSPRLREEGSLDHAPIRRWKPHPDGKKSSHIFQ